MPPDARFPAHRRQEKPGCGWHRAGAEAFGQLDACVVVMTAPQPTLEALMYSLRERGTKALEEAATKRRFSELSDRQIIEVGDRLQKLRPQIARAWSTEEVRRLLRARIK